MTATTTIRWLAGDAAIRDAVERLLARGDASFEILSTNPRRHVAAATLPASARGASAAGRDAPLAIVLKTHRLATGRHPLRERIKRALGRSPARREWRALGALWAAGVPVPRPLAWGRLASGDELVVLERLPGRPLAEALREDSAADAADRRADRIAQLAATLARLAASGHVHGDLQLGNLWLGPPAAGGSEDLEAKSETVHLLDLQRARRPAPASSARLRDLARLELSLLRARLPAAWRLELRAALGIGREGDTALRRFAADHLRGRARRSLRGGRRRDLAPVRDARWRGEREASLEASTLLGVVAAAAADPARRRRREGRTWIAEAMLDGRAVVVKGSAAGNVVERLVAAIRGSRARRAFENGRREQLLLARSARPLAWLEERGRLGLPGASVLVLERVGEADLDACRTEGEAAALDLATCVAEGIAALHAVGVVHADLKGSNVRVGRRRPGDATDPKHQAWDFWLVDLEDLVLPARATDEARLTAWAQLNASLADAHFDCAVRDAALAHALALLPFEDAGLDFEGARREIVRRSLARNHRWRGAETDPSALSRRSR